MNHFPFYPGDYLRDTADLSLEEHGAFLLLLCHYLMNGNLPGTPLGLFRVTHSVTDSEKKSTEAVANRFFPVGADGNRSNTKANTIRLNIINKIDTAKANGKHGGRTQNKPSGVPSGKAIQNHKEQEQSTAIAVEVGSKRADIPYAEILKLYHETLPELPSVRKLTHARKAQIAQRWREDLTDLDDWRMYFEKFVRPSDFLMGRATPSGGRKVFRASLGWLVKADNYAKTIEGNYSGQVPKNR